MKQGWEIKKLGEVCRYIKEQGRYSDLPYIGMEDIESATNIFTGNLNNKSVDSATFRFRSGFVLFGRLRPYLRKVLIPSFEGHCSTEIFPIQTTSALKSEFLKHWFMLDSTVSLVENTCTGARMPRANMNNVLDFVIPIPSILEQERIVGILDSAFVKIEALRANAQQNFQNTKDLFQASLKQELSPKQGWKNKSVKEISKDIFAGGDAPRDNLSEAKTEKYSIPIYANAVKDDGLYGFTDFARVLEPSLTIAARGSGTGYVLERQEAYLPIVRLIVIIPKYEQILLRYLYYSFKGLDITRSGSAIPQLTVPMIKNYTISFPSIVEQQSIVEKLDALSEHCRAMEENYRQTIAHCNALKQALLTKAFNGEL